MAADDEPTEFPERAQCRIFISYQRGKEPDVSLASYLFTSLTSQGRSVFKDIDRIPTGGAFSDLISNEISHSDFFVVLLTKESATRGWVVAETELAKDSEALTGHPKILPVRLAYPQKLPLPLRATIGHLQHFEWHDATDNEKLLAALAQAIQISERPRAANDRAASQPTALLRGEHYIITDRLWESGGGRESLAGTTIVPVIAGQETSLAVTRAKGPGFFRVKVLESGALEVAIWSGTSYRRVRSRPRRFIPMMEGDTHSWCFARYMPDESVLIKRAEGRADPIAVTFDESLVRAVWTITHQRGTIHESFLIAMKHQQA